MELKNMKHEETKRVEVYYEQFQKLIHGLQVPTTNNLLTIVFKAGSRSYFKIATTRMKQSTIQHTYMKMLCE